MIVFKGGRIVSKGSVAQVLNDELLAKIYGDVCTFERLAQKEVSCLSSSYSSKLYPILRTVLISSKGSFARS